MLWYTRTFHFPPWFPQFAVAVRPDEQLAQCSTNSRTNCMEVAGVASPDCNCLLSMRRWVKLLISYTFTLLSSVPLVIFPRVLVQEVIGTSSSLWTHTVESMVVDSTHPLTRFYREVSFLLLVSPLVNPRVSHHLAVISLLCSIWTVTTNSASSNSIV